MGLGSVGSYIWWFTLGALVSWILWWLIERLFLRDTETPRLLTEAQTEIEALKASDALRLSEMEELQSQTQQQTAGLREELRRYNGLEQAYEAEYNKVVAEQRRQAEELAQSSSEVTRLQTILDGTPAKIAALAALETELEQARSRESGLKTEFTEISQQLSAARSEAEALRRKLTEQDTYGAGALASPAGLEAARREIETKNDEIARLKSAWSLASEHSAQAARLQLDLEQRDTRLKTLESESETLKSVLIESKSALERQRDEIERHRGIAANLRSEAETLRSSEKRLAGELAAATSRVAALDKLRAKLEAAREAAAGYASEAARLNEEFDASLKADPEPDGKKS